MDKQKVLSSISDLAAKNLLTRDEVLKAFDKGQPKHAGTVRKDIGISEVLYFIGGIIVFSGIAVLIGQNWDALNPFTRLLTTLGFGVIVYSIGVLLNKEETYGGVGYAFHLIAALVLPLGLGVFLDQMGYQPDTADAQSLIAGVLVAMYLASYFVFKKTIFTFFTIAYATWLFFSFTNYLVGPNPYITDYKFYEYRFLFVGLSYLLFGYYFASTQQKALTGALYGFGNLFFLGAALALGGWEPEQNIFWELLFPGLVFAVLLLSVKLKSKSFLTFGTIFLMAYILKITGEYFSGTLGWPLSLMLCGIALIAIGYYSFTINNKYIASNT